MLDLHQYVVDLHTRVQFMELLDSSSKVKGPHGVELVDRVMFHHVCSIAQPGALVNPVAEMLHSDQCVVVNIQQSICKMLSQISVKRQDAAVELLNVASLCKLQSNVAHAHDIFKAKVIYEPVFLPGEHERTVLLQILLHGSENVAIICVLHIVLALLVALRYCSVCIMHARAALVNCCVTTTPWAGTPKPV